MIGVKAIQRVLGGASEATVLKWRREYPTMPIKKLGGQLTAHRGELERWFLAYVTDELENYKPSKHNRRAAVV